MQEVRKNLKQNGAGRRGAKEEGTLSSEDNIMDA